MPRFPTLSALLLSATALAALPHLSALPVPPAYADGETRDKGERREKGPSDRADKAKGGKDGGGKEARGNGNNGKGGGGSSGGGSSGGGSSGGGSSGGGSSGGGGGSSGGGSGGGGPVGGGPVGGGPVGGGPVGGGPVGGGPIGGDPIGGGPIGGDPGGGGVIGNDGGPVGNPSGGNAPRPANPPTLSGSNGSPRPSVIVLRAADPARLGPYADALLRVAEARRALAEAEAALARLRGLSGTALARAFPATAPSHDAAAHRRDLQRMDGAVAEWQRLSALTEDQRAAEFPPRLAGDSHDAEALAAAKRRALIRARDHETLANLSPDRLAELYPAPRAAGHDRAAHARAIEAAEAEVELRTIAVTRAEAAAAETLYILTDGQGLTAREAAWVDAYLAR